MAVYRYCTPEWLEACARNYQSDPSFREKLKKVSANLCYRITAEPEWGIDRDIIFGMFVDAGELKRIGFISQGDAKQESDYIMAATPQDWKKILRRESKFITEFMLGKIKLEHGSRVGVLGIAPHANDVVDALTRDEIQFPDEMSSNELAEYRSYIEEFRSELGV